MGIGKKGGREYGIICYSVLGCYVYLRVLCVT